MYKIDTNVFSLFFEPYIDHGAFGDKNIERLRVRVTSYGFSAEATMNVDKKWLADFAKELNVLYENLEGGAGLEEYRGHSRIQFSFLNGGHVHIMGTLYDSHEQELNFSNSIDQTELRKFAKSLYHDLCEV